MIKKQESEKNAEKDQGTVISLLEYSGDVAFRHPGDSVKGKQDKEEFGSAFASPVRVSACTEIRCKNYSQSAVFRDK